MMCAWECTGVWHAAGVLADGLLTSQVAGSLARVCAPKTHGACTLQRACGVVVLRACALFSSVAALLGGAGQANYSAANACLDALASCGRTCARVATSVQWGAWSEAGMAVASGVLDGVRTMGVRGITNQEGMAALEVVAPAAAALGATAAGAAATGLGASAMQALRVHTTHGALGGGLVVGAAAAP